MKYITQSMTFEIQEPTILTLGKFDGLHRGHELLFQCMAKKKQEQRGLKAVIFTFDIPPKERVQNIRMQALTTSSEKKRLFQEMGIDYVIECPLALAVLELTV